MGLQKFSTNSRLGDAICYAWLGLVGWPLAFRRSIVRLGMAAVAVVSLSGCGRYGALEMPPGPVGIQPTPAALSASPPGPVGSSSEPLGGPTTSQETIAKTGFDAHGNPAATPGQKKPFFLDPLLQ